MVDHFARARLSGRPGGDGKEGAEAVNRVFFTAVILAAAGGAAAGELELEIPFDPGSVELLEDGICTMPVFTGMSLVEVDGLPRLPVLPVRVALPTGCAARSVEVLDAVYSPLPGEHRIAPAGPLVPLSLMDAALPSAPDPHVYSLDTPWPGESCRLSGSGVVWGIPMAYLTVNPVRWNPATLELEVLSHLSVSIRFEQDPAARTVSRRSAASEAQAMDLARRLVVNPEGVSPSGAELVCERELEYGQYVIITSPDYSAQAQELADWKTAKGVPARVFTTSWVASQYSCYDLQQEMRAFLADCRDEGADWVLIFGDDDKVAARDAYMSAYGETENAPSDLYFADNNDTAPGADHWDTNNNHIWGEPTDDVDWHPDLWVGRASVNSSSEAGLFVDKVFNYENVPGTDYFETGPREMRVGYTTGVLWYSPYYSGAASAEIISGYIPSSVWEEEKCYEENGNSGAVTIAMINAGPHHVYHASHGSQTYMYTSYGSNYGVSDIMAQTNISSGHLPAIWNSIACFIGQIDGYECCGDAWLASPNGGGFGCFNSRYGWGHYGAAGYGPSERICERFYYEHLVAGVTPLGQAHLVSMDHFCPPEAHSDSFDVDVLDWCLKEYNLLGDPELPMWTEQAAGLTVSHPSSIGGYAAVTVNVASGGSPVQNARVCLQKGDWQTGEVYEVGFTNASGNVTLYATPESTGNITVTVTAHNRNPYQGVITVTGTGAGGQEEAFGRLVVSPVTPCPANASVSIAFSTPSPGPVRIETWDVAGRLLGTIFEGELEEGPHTLQWSLDLDDGRGLPSGVYWIVVKGPGGSASARAVVLR